MKIVDWVKNPESTLDYLFDWSEWMNVGDRIKTFDINIEDQPNTTENLIVVQKAKMSKRIIVWLTGGQRNKKYKISCKITTINGRTETSSRTIRIVNRKG